MPSANCFPSTVNIASVTQNNVAGGRTVTYAVTVSGVPALVTDASASLQLVYAQRQMMVDHVIYVSQAVTTNTGDIIVYGSRNFFVKRVLDVSGTGRVFAIHAQEAAPGTIIIEQ